jgi:ABC-type transport system involved in multi-copper enzyme maturation permease subunit
MRMFVIARLTFKEAARRKILLAALVLGLVFLVVFGIGYHLILREMEVSPYGPEQFQRNEISNFLFTAGLYVVNFLTAMMTVLTSVDTVSGEIQSGTIHTLISKPVRRWEILLGKWLGFAGMITLYLLLMAGGVTLLVMIRSNLQVQHPLEALGLLELNALILLSVSLLGGTFLSTLANGVLVFGLFGVAFIGGWIEQIGSFLPKASASQAASNIGVITSLILPSEALWKRVAYEVQSPLVASLGFSPFVSRTIPSPLMIGYAVFFMLVITLMAVRLFQRRDL